MRLNDQISMLKKFLIIFTFLSFAHAQAQCNNYWQYVKGDNNDGLQGIVTFPPQSVSEHKIKILLSVGSKLVSVSKKYETSYA